MGLWTAIAIFASPERLPNGYTVKIPNNMLLSKARAYYVAILCVDTAKAKFLRYALIGFEGY